MKKIKALATKVQKDDRIFLDTSKDHSGGIKEDTESILNSLFKALYFTRKDRELDAEVPDRSYTHSQSGIRYKS